MDTETILAGARGFLGEFAKQDNFGTYRPIYAVMEAHEIQCLECEDCSIQLVPKRWFFIRETAEEYMRREHYNLSNASIHVFSASGNIEYELIVNAMKLCVEQAAEIERLKKEIRALTARAG